MTQRAIQVLILLLGFQFSYAQKTSVTRFQLGPSLQISTFSYLLKDDFGYREFKAALNFHGGFNGTYILDQYLSIGTDLSFGTANFKQALNLSEIPLLDNNDPFLFPEDAILRKQIALNLNLYVNYRVIRKEKHSLLIGVGPTSLILLHQAYEINEPLLGLDISDFDRQYFYNDILTGAVLRIENRFDISPKAKLSFTPFIAYYVNSAHRNPNINAQPIHLGINAATLLSL